MSRFLRPMVIPCVLFGLCMPLLAGPVDYNRSVRPILSDRCYKCHGPDSAERKAGLRLDVREEALAPRKKRGAAIVPGKPTESSLIARVFSTDPDEVMPPPDSKKLLSQAEKETLRQWIAEGASYQLHWSFRPMAKPPLPPFVGKDSTRDWPRSQIDRFVLARLEQESLSPRPEADRATLIRRLSLDLTGLPPTLEALDAFLADSRVDAYDQLVESLLDSPRYGERMALEWLDAARFADTHGYHIDCGRDMTRWREWVIDAFNQNKPFDQFTVEQIAGDLLPSPTLEQRVASGFNRNHMINFEGGAIPDEYHTAYIVDRVNTTATVWLGLTVACAQCHDHKYDPLTQKEFYQLFAFFHNVPENGLDGSRGNATPLIQVPTAAQSSELEKVSGALVRMQSKWDGPIPELDSAQAEWETSARQRASSSATPDAAVSLPPKVAAALARRSEDRTPEDSRELREHFRKNVSAAGKQLLEQLEQAKKTRSDLDRRIPTAMVMQEMEKPRDTFILMRGQYDKRGEKVEPGVPAALPALPDGAPRNRLGLARWLVDPRQPLTARVIVNRYWQMYFGTGLVKTAEDFGSQGEAPSHPDLLDWLAATFIESGWDVKAMQRLIVTSATYRQASRITPELFERDPENRLIARGPRLRLQAEAIRDQALFVSGLLDDRIGGASVSPYQPPGLWEELMSRADGANWTAQTYVQSHGPDLYRRTMYTFWKRTSPPPTLVTFDAPDRETCTVRRPRTNTPLQALILMNDPTYIEASRKLAERLLRASPTIDERIRFAFRLCTAREPNDVEVRLLRGLVTEQLGVYELNRGAAEALLKVGEAPGNSALGPAELAAWTVLASAILNLDETVTKG